MKQKKYVLYKLLIVMLLALIVGFFVARGNFVIPLIVLFFAMALMMLLKKKADFVLRDERVEKIGGMAARVVLTITTFLIAIAGMILIALKSSYPEYYIIGNVLAYLACGMLILYAALFKFYSRK